MVWHCYVPAPKEYHESVSIPRALSPEFIGGHLVLAGPESELRAFAAKNPSAVMFEAEADDQDEKMIEHARQMGEAVGRHMQRVMIDAMKERP